MSDIFRDRGATDARITVAPARSSCATSCGLIEAPAPSPPRPSPASKSTDRGRRETCSRSKAGMANCESARTSFRRRTASAVTFQSHAGRPDASESPQATCSATAIDRWPRRRSPGQAVRPPAIVALAGQQPPHLVSQFRGRFSPSSGPASGKTRFHGYGVRQIQAARARPIRSANSCSRPGRGKKSASDRIAKAVA